MPHTPIRVLLIEDDPGDARLIREMLLSNATNDFTLNVAGTLAEGIQQATKEISEIVLLDLTLPDSSGMDTLLQLRSHFPEPPVIVLTGLDGAQNLGLEAVQAGAQDYLVKGDVDAQLLRRAIRYAIERHDIKTRLRRSEREYRSLIDDVFDTSRVAVFVLDAAFTVVWCNEATETYFGLDRESILGRDKRELIAEDIKLIFEDPDHFASSVLEAYEQRWFSEQFECHVLPDGDRAERWLEHWSQPIRDGMYRGGRIEQYTDITERKRLQAVEQDQRRFAEALRDIARELTGTLDLDTVLQRIFDNLQRVVPHDSAWMTMLEDDHIWAARRGSGDAQDTQEVISERLLRARYHRYLDHIAATRTPLIVPDVHADDVQAGAATSDRLHAYIGAPILLQGEIIGFINLLNEMAGSFTDQNAERLTAFAGLAAIAIQNARLYAQTRELAAVEERQRLARDLHDSVSQTIFTCRTMLEAALRRFESDPVRAKQLVEEVQQLVITALSEMRILLLELRPDALTQVSLRELFEQYLKPIQTRRAFSLDLNIADVPHLPGPVQIALYRITQEALNNIDKHAGASRVTVRVAFASEALGLEICDDGAGFDMRATSGTSLGLGIMRERAAEIGAQIAIESSPGSGTCIRVKWNPSGEEAVDEPDKQD